MVAHDLGEYQRARVILEESLSLAREVGNKLIIAWALSNLAEVLQSLGEGVSALPMLEKGISQWRALQTWGLAFALYSRAQMALALGDLERASVCYRESLELWSRLGTQRGIADCLEGFAGLALAQSRWVEAVRLYAAAETLRQAIGAPRPPHRRAEYEEQLARLRRKLGEEGFATVWIEGQAMTTEQVRALIG